MIPGRGGSPAPWRSATRRGEPRAARVAGTRARRDSGRANPNAEGPRATSRRRPARASRSRRPRTRPRCLASPCGPRRNRRAGRRGGRAPRCRDRGSRAEAVQTSAPERKPLRAARRVPRLILDARGAPGLAERARARGPPRVPRRPAELSRAAVALGRGGSDKDGASGPRAFRDDATRELTLTRRRRAQNIRSPHLRRRCEDAVSVPTLATLPSLSRHHARSASAMGRDSERISNGSMPSTAFAVCGHESVRKNLEKPCPPRAARRVNRFQEFPRKHAVRDVRAHPSAQSGSRSFWHSMSVPPLCTRSSTIRDVPPRGLALLELHEPLPPSRTFVHTTSSMPLKKPWKRLRAPRPGYAMTMLSASGHSARRFSSSGMPLSKHGRTLSPK